MFEKAESCAKATLMDTFGRFKRSKAFRDTQRSTRVSQSFVGAL